ncbi:MAG: alkaline phosphatase [Ignavibacteriae bacterium]|nr:MAG: alkaline phosphatase [Ignavibacteriota bacterium]
MKKFIFLTLLFLQNFIFAGENDTLTTGNVIFIHPDGTGLTNWYAMRTLYYGPDSCSNWDKLPQMAIYSTHTKNTLTTSSNAGATMHSYGKKVVYDSYGMNGTDTLTALSGKKLSIMQEAKSKGILTGIVNSGHIIEPGTGVFAASSKSRKNTEEIAKKIAQSGLDLIFSGGEDFLLPKGVKGKFCTGKREDGLNLIEWLKENGYEVIYTKEELLNLTGNEKKVFGVFAEGHTFNDESEEKLKELGLQNFNPEAPTIAEMTEAAIKFFDKKNKQFFLVAEEEATDNFGNYNNANGMLQALKRADDAIGIASKFVDKNKKTMLITASDSEAGGMEILNHKKLEKDKPTPANDKTGSQYDGQFGTGTIPFVAKPDKFGNAMPFIIGWTTASDLPGCVVARAKGLNENLMRGSIQNTDIYRFMYATLFGKLLEKEKGKK